MSFYFNDPATLYQDDSTDFSDYPAERELDFSAEEGEILMSSYAPPCPLCSDPEYKHKTARKRCELCGDYIVTSS